LVCDEPTSALDGHTGHTIMTILRGIAVQAGRAVVVVTHDSRVYGFGDRIAYMEDGRIVNVERQAPSLEIRQAEHGARLPPLSAAPAGDGGS
jgi:putative ABC transport system ATP-binding protein